MYTKENGSFFLPHGVDSYKDKQLRYHTAISANIVHLWILQTCAIQMSLVMIIIIIIILTQI